VKGYPVAVLVLALYGCGEPSSSEGDVCPEPEIGSVQEPLSTINCSTGTDVGYTNGKQFPITVVTVDGKQVEQETANAYYVMAQAASADGVEIRINSGFRTMASQEYLYACYINCNCNSCSLAAKPGYSNHQSGHALDLNTAATGVLAWLNAHGAAYGFKPTVPSEAWHWEWWGGGPGGGPCGSAGDAAVDRTDRADRAETAPGDRDASLDSGGPAGDSAPGGEEASSVSDATSMGPVDKTDAGASNGSAGGPAVVHDEAEVVQGGCSCRIGAMRTGHRGSMAQAAALLASLALIAARRRSKS
jgi:D-alanyl-D-alanine carboxypeptidase